MEFLVLPGDGIGPEITAAVVAALQRLDTMYSLRLELAWGLVGFESLRKSGTTFAEEILIRARAAHGVILGPVSHKDYPPLEAGGRNPSAELRKGLDLYANIRPARALQHLSRFPALDLTIVRENTEGFYADRNMFSGNGEFAPTAEVVLAVRKVTRLASERVARIACDLALQRRRRLTIVHKANVLRMSDGLFLGVAREVAARYPSLSVDDILVDAMASMMVRSPEEFDVVVTTNMFGDILSNLSAELAGGLGAAGSINAGDQHAMAQAAHGSAPTIAGADIANPAGLMYSAALLLEWLGRKHDRPEYSQAGRTLHSGVTIALGAAETRTPDVLGTASTSSMTKAILELLPELSRD